MKLNLGCGDKILPGYENYDYCPLNDDVKYIDLNDLPLPFDDNSVDEIILSHVLEHLEVNHLFFMNDLLRILRPGGSVVVTLPPYYPSVEHNSILHSKHYMDPFIYRNNVELCYLKKKRLSLWHTLWFVKDFIVSLFYKEYIWKIKKK